MRVCEGEVCGCAGAKSVTQVLNKCECYECTQTVGTYMYACVAQPCTMYSHGIHDMYVSNTQQSWI